MEPRLWHFNDHWNSDAWYIKRNYKSPIDIFAKPIHCSENIERSTYNNNNNFPLLGINKC